MTDLKSSTGSEANDQEIRSSSNDYRKKEDISWKETPEKVTKVRNETEGKKTTALTEVKELGGGVDSAIPPEMAAAISALVANREKGKGNSTMRVVTAKEMEELELERELQERKEKGDIVLDLKEPDAETQAAINSFIHSPYGPDPKETIDYGYPIRMTLKFLDNTVSGVPHVMTIRRLDYLDPDTDNEEFPEYSRWFMSNLPDYNPEDPADYDPNKPKLYTFKATTIEWELGAFDVIKYLPYIGSTWDYSSQADPGEKTGKMVPASMEQVVYKKTEDKLEAEAGTDIKLKGNDDDDSEQPSTTTTTPTTLTTIHIPSSKVKKNE